jgi:glycosyltransferase involved in cell wall biosynthesis
MLSTEVVSLVGQDDEEAVSDRPRRNQSVNQNAPQEVSTPDAVRSVTPLRLVHVTTVPASLWGFFEGQIGYMLGRGFQVEAISSPGEYLERFAAREGVVVHAIPMTRRITPCRDLVSLVRLWGKLRQLKPDIVHAHTPKAGLLGTLAAWLARISLRVYHVHGCPFTAARGLRRRLLRWMERLACWCATEVWAVSDSLSMMLISEKLCPERKIRVIAKGTINGIDASRRFAPHRFPPNTRLLLRSSLGIPKSAIVVGYVGRLVRDKGLTELVEAWRLLREQFPDLHLLVVGPFELQDPLAADIEATLREDPRIHLTGMVTDTAFAYSTMDLCILPSYREGFGLVALEAAAMELPVVATNIPGCIDAVQNGVTGTLVPPRNYQALTQAILAYLSDPHLRQRHGSAGRQRVLRDFQREHVWEATWREYTRLLEQTNHGSRECEELGATERELQEVRVA